MMIVVNWLLNLKNAQGNAQAGQICSIKKPKNQRRTRLPDIYILNTKKGESGTQSPPQCESPTILPWRLALKFLKPFSSAKWSDFYKWTTLILDLSKRVISMLSNLAELNEKICSHQFSIRFNKIFNMCNKKSAWTNQLS